MTKEEFKEKIKVKKWEFENWVTDKAWRAKMFWDQNKEYLVVLIPVVAGVGHRVIGRANSMRRQKNEEYLKKQFMYDRRNGCYLEMRRKPTQNEYLEIDRRKKNGESLPSILSSMKLLR